MKYFKKEFKNFGFIFVGSALFCTGINLFISPVGLYNGGTVGIAQIIRTLLSSSLSLPEGFDITGIINFLINLPLLYLAFRQFGRGFFFKTVFSIITQTLLFSAIFIPGTPIIDDRLAACFIGGALAGAGVGLTLQAGGSGGGNDILGLYFTKKFKSFSVGKMTLIVNGIVYFICALLFEPPTAIYSIIYSLIYSNVADHIHLQNINVSVMIFTKTPSLYEKILTDINRDVTYWNATGAYTETDTYVLFCILSKYEVQQLKQIIDEVDPNSFVVISERPQILGNFEVRL